MENTLQDFSDPSVERIPIQVLLATYNGAKYLDEFLKSLLAQVGVEIELIVSDDGSSDETLNIIEKYRDSFEKLHIYAGPGKGPSENFFSLLEIAAGEYMAFADQDDIWEPTHLHNSVKRLEQFANVPALTFSQSLAFGEEIGKQIPWPRIKKMSSKILFAQNLARGCTEVFNRKLVELVLAYSHDASVMHDWWLAQVAASCGTILFEPSVEVFYRIHNANSIGIPKPNFFPKAIQSKQRVWEPAEQLNSLFENFAQNMHRKTEIEISKFLQNLTGGLVRRVCFLTFSPNRFRLRFIDEIKIRLGFAFYPLFFDLSEN